MFHTTKMKNPHRWFYLVKGNGVLQETLFPSKKEALRYCEYYYGNEIHYEIYKCGTIGCIHQSKTDTISEPILNRRLLDISVNEFQHMLNK